MFKIDCSGENPVLCDSVEAAWAHVRGALARGVRGGTVTGLDGRPFSGRVWSMASSIGRSPWGRRR